MTAPEQRPPPEPTLAQRLARLLRHEVGDLLQAVYATVAVLHERLPAASQERRLLTDLRSRAELCKFELEAVVDLVYPAAERVGVIDLGRAVESAHQQARQRFPQLALAWAPAPELPVTVDTRLFPSAMTFLLLGVCQAARHTVGVRLEHDGDGVRCHIDRDGFPVTAEQQLWLDEPFATTQQAAFGLALALVQRAVRAGGGTVSVRNREAGGVQLSLAFPVAANAPSPASSAP